jgi:hypothetical protein
MHPCTHAPTHAGTWIVGASCGRYNCALLDDAGGLHVWGYDGCGTEGVLPAREDAWKAKPVKGELLGKRVVAVDSGGCRSGWTSIVPLQLSHPP